MSARRAIVAQPSFAGGATVTYKLLIRLLSLALAVVLGLLLISLWPEPSAATLAKRHDVQRVRELNLIVENIHDFRNRHGALPFSLQQLAESKPRLTWHDPVTGQPYDYILINATVYSLCASFETDARDERFGSLPGFSNHGIGSTCIYRTFD